MLEGLYFLSRNYNILLLSLHLIFKLAFAFGMNYFNLFVLRVKSNYCGWLYSKCLHASVSSNDYGIVYTLITFFKLFM